MVKLYGTSISNYFSTAKAAFIEKEVPFEEVSVFPSQKPEVLAVSPMGKVPYIAVEGNILTETNVIFDYLEGHSATTRTLPERPLGQGQSQRAYPRR